MTNVVNICINIRNLALREICNFFSFFLSIFYYSDSKFFGHFNLGHYCESFQKDDDGTYSQPHITLKPTSSYITPLIPH